ncbi:hypothetical protein MTO96_031070 [Rhipicephalus appendiculatus]
MEEVDIDMPACHSVPQEEHTPMKEVGVQQPACHSVDSVPQGERTPMEDVQQSAGPSVLHVFVESDPAEKRRRRKARRRRKYRMTEDAEEARRIRQAKFRQAKVERARRPVGRPRKYVGPDTDPGMIAALLEVALAKLARENELREQELAARRRAREEEIAARRRERAMLRAAKKQLRLQEAAARRQARIEESAARRRVRAAQIRLRQQEIAARRQALKEEMATKRRRWEAKDSGAQRRNKRRVAATTESNRKELLENPPGGVCHVCRVCDRIWCANELLPGRTVEQFLTCRTCAGSLRQIKTVNAAHDTQHTCTKARPKTTTSQRRQRRRSNKCVGEAETLPQHANQSCQTEHHITLLQYARPNVSTRSAEVQVNFRRRYS